MDIKLANGAVISADASVNQAELKSQYEKNREVWDTLFEYLAKTPLDEIAEGKTVIIPGRLWLNMATYTPKGKDAQRIEQHHNYIDLDYTFAGNEEMGIAHGSEATDEYNAEKDVQHFAGGNVEYYKTNPDKYFVFFPCDLHQPSVQAPGEVETSRRLIAKIEYKH